MRDAAVFVVDLPAQAGWRRLVFALIGTSALAAGGWWLLPVPGITTGWRGGLALAALLMFGLAWPVSRIRACRLRWDGVDWWHGELPAEDAQMRSGRLRVTLDVSLLMLLRFEVHAAVGRQRVRWIPVLPSGLEARWHALRCAVYSARPSTRHPASGDPPHPAST